jgi:hypothetical protein
VSREDLLEAERAARAEEKGESARLGKDREAAVARALSPEVRDDLREELALLSRRKPAARRPRDLRPGRTVEEDEAREEEERREEERGDGAEGSTRAERLARRTRDPDAEEPRNGRKRRNGGERGVGIGRNGPEGGPPRERETQEGGGEREPGRRIAFPQIDQGHDDGHGEDERKAPDERRHDRLAEREDVREEAGGEEGAAGGRDPRAARDEARREKRPAGEDRRPGREAADTARQERGVEPRDAQVELAELGRHHEVAERAVGHEVGEGDARHRHAVDRRGEAAREGEEAGGRTPRPGGNRRGEERGGGLGLREEGERASEAGEGDPSRGREEERGPGEADGEERRHRVGRDERPVFRGESEDSHRDRGGPGARDGRDEPPPRDEERGECPGSGEETESDVRRHARAERAKRSRHGVGRERPVVVADVLPEALPGGEAHRDGPLPAQVPLERRPAKPREGNEGREKRCREDEVRTAGEASEGHARILALSGLMQTHQ